jgi:hypothetical protein
VSLDRARLSVEFCLGRLRLQVEELTTQQYPGNHTGPKLWLELTIGLLDTAASYLVLSANAPTADESVSLVRDAARLGTLTYQCLNLMQGSSIAHLSPPIAAPLQRWLDSLGFKNSALFRAEATANYELLRIEDKTFTRIREATSTLTSAINNLKWPIFRITVPTKAFGIIPHFAIVAHEIGHALCDRVIWDLSGFAVEEQKLVARISSKTGAPITAQHQGTLQKVFLSWFQELASDAFAFLLTGPAIFFSLCDFFQLLGNGYGLCQTHPANDLRRRAVFQQLIDASAGPSFAEIFERHTGEPLVETFNSGILIPTPTTAEIWNDVRGTGADDATAAIMSELHGSMPHLLSIIYTQARSHLIATAPIAIYTVEQYDADLTSHLKPMLAAIPPIESASGDGTVPTDFASILNVGWATLLTKLDDFRIATDGNDYWERMEALHNLLEKAVELSEVKRLWESA